MKLLYIAVVILLIILWYNYSGYMEKKNIFEDIVISKQQQQQIIYDKVQVSDNIKLVISEPTPKKNKMKVNIEFQESKIEDISSYTADTGLVNAVHKESSEYILTPFQNSPKDIQTEVVSYLKKEWYESNKKDDTFSIDFIKTTWNDANNILYVLMQKNLKDSNLVRLIGTVAIDRKQFVPFFSQLFVVPHERNKGYANILIKHAEKYIKKMRFNKSKLWCKPDLINFYNKLGYDVEDKKDEVYIMSKSI